MNNIDLNKVKSFREQLIECKTNGILFREICPWCGHLDNMCKKYGGRCHSGKCRDERINNQDDIKGQDE